MHKQNESVISLPARAAHSVGVNDQTSSLRGKWFVMLPVAVAWLSLFWVLSTDWSINSQYSYGWVVPFLGLAVFWQRWTSRPAPSAKTDGGRALLGAGAALLAALPVRLIEEANPEWRLILWTHAGLVVLLSLAQVGYGGGRSWVKHFAFAVAFPLVGVPLPMGWEQHAIQGLTQMVTLVTAELAHLNGIPAFQHGNVIEIGTGMVGVEEACSGIRSLQSTFLVALFLGEFYRFSIPRRAALIALGFAIAILSNIGRTYALVHLAARDGLQASQRIHDTAANVALLSALGILFLLAWLMRRKAAFTSNPSTVAHEEAPAAETTGVRTLPGWFCGAALLWMAAVGVFVEWWYSRHERDALPNARWAVREPVVTEGFQPIEIPERSRSILRYSRGHCMTWRDASAFQWRLYYLRWEPGRNSAQLAKAHTPEICLSGAGGKLKQYVGESTFAHGSLQLPFDQYVFDFSGQPLHVFYCLWEDQRPRPGQQLPEDGTQQSRLSAVRAGRRHLGQTVIEAAVRGPATAEEARELFAAELQRLVVQ